MFNYLRTENGKITLKVLATLLVITLTFANFILLGSYLGKGNISYAADESSTDSPNVLFNVYLKEDKTKELIVDMNSDDLNLYVYAEVINQGELKDAKLKLENANFKLIENNKEKDEVSLGSIKAGSKIEKAYKISLKKDSNFDLSWLNKGSKVRLTGTYSYEKSGSITNEAINSTKDVTIKYDAPAQIAGQDNENHKAEITSEVITNEVLKVDGEPKRVIQQLVTSQIVNNSYPIKSTYIEADAPKLGAEYPESIKVASYGTVATNGKYLEFGEKEESKLGGYEYDEEAHKVKITVNNTPDSDNIVSWEKSGADTFVITYVYPENATATNIQTKATSEIKMYTYMQEDENKVSKAVEDTIDFSDEILLLPMLTVEATQETFKGNMKLGKDTGFITLWVAGVSDIRLVDEMALLNLDEDKFNEEAGIDPTTYFKTTYINVEDMRNMLGENGTATITDGENNVLVTINNEYTEKETLNGVEYYKAQYEGDQEEIVICLSKPKKEGIITIINDKVLKSDNNVKTKLDKITSLTTSAAFNFINGNGGPLIPSEQTSPMTISDTSTVATAGANKTNISATETTEVNYTVTLKQDKIKYDLYKNPTIELEFPSYINEVEITNKELTNGNGLSVVGNPEIKTSNGKKIVKFTLSGEINDYVAENPQLSIRAELTPKELTPTLADQVKVTVTNENNATPATTQISLKAIAESKMITAMSVKVANNETTALPTGNEEEVPVEVTGAILNNTGKNTTNVAVIGKVNGENSNILAELNSITAEGAQIFYTADSEVTANSNWVSEKPENVKGYKIVFATINDKETKTFTYKIMLPKGLEVNKSMDIKYVVINENETTNSKVITLQTPQETRLELTVEPTIENNTTVYEGQTLSYKVKVKNTGNNIAKNIEVTNVLSEGLTLLANNQKDWTIASLEAGATDEKTIQVTVNNLPEEETTKTVTMQTTVEQQYLEETKTNTVTNTVNKAPISVKFELIEGNNEFILGNEVYYVVSITNNTNNNIENLKIENEQPKELDYYIMPYFYESLDNMWLRDNNIYKSEGITLNGGQTIHIRIDARVIDYNETGLSNLIKLTWQGGTPLSITDSRQMERPLPVDVTVTSNSENKEVKTGDLIEYIINVKNDNDQNVMRTIKTAVSEGLEITKIEIPGVEVLDMGGNREYTKSLITLEPNSNIKIKVTVKVVSNSEEIEDDIELSVNASTEKANYIENSNKVKFILKKFVMKPIVVSMTSPKENNEVKTGDVFEYFVTLRNENEKNISPDLKIKLSEGLEILKIEQIDTDNRIIASVDLKNTREHTLDDIIMLKESDIVFKITTKVIKDETKLTNDIKLTAQAEVINDNNSEKSDIISVILKKSNGNPADPSNPDNPSEPDDPKTQKYILEGKAWLDENKDGKIGNEEKTVSGITIKIKDAIKGEFLKDKDNKEITAKTDNEGKYQFKDLPKGKYIIVFDVDLKKYGITVGDDTSAVIATEEDITVVKTDAIEIKDKNIENVNIGLVENPKFDLQLDKYVTKITVQNVDGTTTYNYDKSQLAKVEIASKKMAGSVVLVEYSIDVTNKGEMPEIVSSIVDYVSPEYAFNSEINENWYQGTDNNLYNLELGNELINPGETKSVKLILTKTMTNTNTGLISNTAEIEEAFNEFATEDINSTPGNREEKENDMSGADVMVSVKTGGAVLYIGIIIASMLILGGGIYLVNKKVIAKRII